MSSAPPPTDSPLPPPMPSPPAPLQPHPPDAHLCSFDDLNSFQASPPAEQAVSSKGEAAPPSKSPDLQPAEQASTFSEATPLVGVSVEAVRVHADEDRVEPGDLEEEEETWQDEARQVKTKTRGEMPSRVRKILIQGSQHALEINLLSQNTSPGESNEQIAKKKPRKKSSINDRRTSSPPPQSPGVGTRSATKRAAGQIDENDDDFVEAPRKKLQKGKGVNIKKTCTKRKRKTTKEVPDDEYVFVAEPKEGKAAPKSQGITVRCSPGLAVLAIESLSVWQQSEVNKLGFRDVCKITVEGLESRDLLAWLMDSINPDDMVIRIDESKELPINEHAVKCVMGLQNSGVEFPTSSMAEKQVELDGLKFDLQAPKMKDIKINNVLKSSRKH